MYRPLRKITYEPIGSIESLTKHEQNMSLKDMIERAERGILDLSMYNTASDYISDTSDPDSISEADFSGNDRFFGQDYESSEMELENLISKTPRKNSKKQKQAQQNERAKHSEENEAQAEADKQ